VSTEEILAAALALPEAERRVLVERLAESLPEDEGDDMYSDPAFQAELDRREANFQENSVPGPEFLARLLGKFEKSRAAG